MADDPSTWASLIQWVGSNPEKGSLALVLLVGAWRYIRETYSGNKADDARESFTDILLEENRKLREELLAERERSRRNRAGEGNEGRTP